jgi:hypothetical protein
LVSVYGDNPTDGAKQVGGPFLSLRAAAEHAERCLSEGWRKCMVLCYGKEAIRDVYDTSLPYGHELRPVFLSEDAALSQPGPRLRPSGLAERALCLT